MTAQIAEINPTLTLSPNSSKQESALPEDAGILHVSIHGPNFILQKFFPITLMLRITLVPCFGPIFTMTFNTHEKSFHIS
jgi:hypothetical protein